MLDDLIWYNKSFQKVSNRTLRLGDNRRNDVMEDMENSAPMVLDLIKQCFDNGL